MREGGVPLPAKRSTRRPVPRPAAGEPVVRRLTSLTQVNASVAPSGGPERLSERQRRRAAAQEAVGEGWVPPSDLESVAEAPAVELD